MSTSHLLRRLHLLLLPSIGQSVLRHVWRYVWPAPVSAAGLVLSAIALCGGARARRVHGVLEVGGGALGRWVDRHSTVQAMTLGHVVLGVNMQVLAAWRTHEHAHVAQYERWGPWMLVRYAATSWQAHRQGWDAYLHNALEREARIVARRGGLPKACRHHAVYGPRGLQVGTPPRLRANPYTRAHDEPSHAITRPCAEQSR
jgi:hypothetical protein